VTRIKICGITNEEDARAAVDYGADALGFIRVPGSPRYVTDHAFVLLGYATRPLVTTVIVVQRPEDAGDLYATYVQHYEETPLPDDPPWTRAVGRFLRAFRIRNEASLAGIKNYPYRQNIAAYLLDTYHPNALGGTGETFNWDLAVEAKRIAAGKPIILAGGLTPGNVAEAVAQVRPYAVDVSSGVEAEPGRKDHEKLRRFIRAVREVDLALEEGRG
jgi:phosphoribosylanthranilate isomerase